MRGAVVGLAFGLALAGVLSWVSGLPELRAQSDRLARADQGSLVPLVWSTEAGTFIAVVDTQSRVLGVYEVQRGTGAIVLKSVRNLTWDLQLEELNTSNPAPREIRALLDRR